jgi:hypothetical protein
MTDRIFDIEPVTWQELEGMVFQAFQEMGYDASRNHEIATVRGKVRVDVYAVQRSNPIPTIVLCECKHWNKAVDQNVIYSFRSVCADAGAHYGVVISKKGFQSGAVESREHTSIHLLTFAEFQNTFFDEWRSGIFIKLARMCDLLMPLVPFTAFYYHPHNAKLIAMLKDVNPFEKYQIFLGDNRYTDFFIERHEFPVTLIDPRGDPHILDKIVVRSPRQYFDIAAEGCKDACYHFNLG